MKKIAPNRCLQLSIAFLFLLFTAKILFQQEDPTQTPVPTPIIREQIKEYPVNKKISSLKPWSFEIDISTYPVDVSKTVSWSSTAFKYRSGSAGPQVSGLVTEEFFGLTSSIQSYEVERQIGAILLMETTNFCPQNPNSLVLDTGVNGGLFYLMAANAGCKVWGFEPQPMCASSVVGALTASKKLQNNRFFNAGLFNSWSKFPIPLCHCDAFFQMNSQVGLSSCAKKHQAQSFSLDYLLEEEGMEDIHVRFWKIDTEGAEMNILKGAMKLIQRRSVDNFVIELMPRTWAAKGVPEEEGVQIITTLIDMGYRPLLLVDHAFPDFVSTWVYREGDLPDIGQYYLVQRDKVAALVKDRVNQNRGMNMWFKKM